MADDIIGVTIEVARALDDCGVVYSVGGSLASGLSGEPPGCAVTASTATTSHDRHSLSASPTCWIACGPPPV